MLATTLANADYISIGLAATIGAAIFAVIKATHKTKMDAAKQRTKDRDDDTARHHDLDKRTDRLEQQAQLAPAISKLTAVIDRALDRDPRASGIYPKDDR